MESALCSYFCSQHMLSYSLFKFRGRQHPFEKEKEYETEISPTDILYNLGKFGKVKKWIYLNHRLQVLIFYIGLKLEYT